jgi:carbamoylphosphate synthase large subunit
MSESRPLNVICLATYFKGGDFIRECKRRGCHVILVTKEKMLAEEWPRDHLDDVMAVPNDAGPPLFIDLAAFIARKNRPDRIVALEEFDVITAALIREHFCLPGLSSSAAKTFRDKMAMAVAAVSAGIDVPAFVPLINEDEVSKFMERVPPPWIIKPRADVSAIGIRKVHEPQQVWKTIHELNKRDNLRERSSYYLLALFIPGEVFHVDSLVNDGGVVFAGANQYGRPPMDVAHQGGAYISHSVPHGSADEKRLFENNKKVVKTLGLQRGATHAEFIKSATDGKFYFLEIAARVGGAYIAEVLEAASGINLWREWAALEVSSETAEQGPANGPSEALPEDVSRELMKMASAKRIRPSRREYAGIILSLAKQESPDTSAYNDPEIVYRVNKKHHAGLIVRSKRLERVKELLDDYARRFAEDFAAVLPPLEKAE